MFEDTGNFLNFTKNKHSKNNNKPDLNQTMKKKDFHLH